ENNIINLGLDEVNHKLQVAANAYSNQKNSVYGRTPFEVSYGRTNRNFGTNSLGFLAPQPNEVYTEEQREAIYAEVYQKCLQKKAHDVRRSLKKLQVLKQKVRELAVGDVDLVVEINQRKRTKGILRLHAETKWAGIAKIEEIRTSRVKTPGFKPDKTVVFKSYRVRWMFQPMIDGEKAHDVAHRWYQRRNLVPPPDKVPLNQVQQMITGTIQFMDVFRIAIVFAKRRVLNINGLPFKWVDPMPLFASIKEIFKLLPDLTDSTDDSIQELLEGTDNVALHPSEEADDPPDNNAVPRPPPLFRLPQNPPFPLEHCKAIPQAIRLPDHAGIDHTGIATDPVNPYCDDILASLKKEKELKPRLEFLPPSQRSSLCGHHFPPVTMNIIRKVEAQTLLIVNGWPNSYDKLNGVSYGKALKRWPNALAGDLRTIQLEEWLNWDIVISIPYQLKVE
ncbi:hypothetical protein HDU89_001713, partial [Geranomyces variabilis]